MSYEKNNELETIAYQCWDKYRHSSLLPSGIVDTINEVRSFYDGTQYDQTFDGPKPITNLVMEYVEKTYAKIAGTDWAVEFTSDSGKNGKTLDDFYSYQMAKMNDKLLTANACKAGMMDGIAVVFTSYDEDTYGTKGKYRGFLKREIVPFERTFYADSHCVNLQDQRYIGYVMSMELGAVKNVIEQEYGDKLQAEKNKKLNALVSDIMFGADGKVDTTKTDSDVNKCTVVTRFFRDKTGEVVFELATRNVNLFITPHYLNPNKNKAFRDALEKVDENEQEPAKKIIDYIDQSPEKYTLFTKPRKQTDEDYDKKLDIFSRYPVATFVPYAINGTIAGETKASQLVQDQKIVNYLWQLAVKAAIREADPKWRAKAEALNGQEIDDTGGQVLLDYTRYSTGWGVDIMQTSVNAKNILDTLSLFIALVKQTFGFDNLTADNLGSDTSGYAIQQVLKQQNLTLEQPQAKLWEYIRENALTDLMYFRFYLDKGADYFEFRGDGEVIEQEAFRDMSQNMAVATNQQMVGADENGQLPPVRNRTPKKIDSDVFLNNYDVCVEVVQGITQSQISESQHYQQVFQYAASGNIDATLMKAWVQADPAFSRKTRENLKSAMNYVENSQLAQKQAEIDSLKQVIERQNATLKYYGQQVQMAQEQVKALKQATKDNARMNEQIAMNAVQKSEGEVKSDNARGINGQSFDGNVLANL